MQYPTQLIWICLVVSAIISSFLYTPPIWPFSCPQSLFNAPQVDDDTSDNDTSMLLLALKIIPLLCHTKIANKSCISSSLHPTVTAVETSSDREQQASPLASPGHYASLPCIIEWQCHPHTWNNNGLTDVRVIAFLSSAVGRQTNNTEKQICKEIVLAKFLQRTWCGPKRIVWLFCFRGFLSLIIFSVLRRFCGTIFDLHFSYH